MKNQIKTILSLISIFAISLGCAHTIELKNSPSVPGAKGNMQVSSDSNDNTIVKLKVEHLAKAQELSPPRQTYVVWADSPYGSPQRLGQLLISDGAEGKFEGTFFAKKFKLLITAEDTVETSTLGPQLVLSSEEVVR